MLDEQFQSGVADLLDHFGDRRFERLGQLLPQLCVVGSFLLRVGKAGFGRAQLVEYLLREHLHGAQLIGAHVGHALLGGVANYFLIRLPKE